MGGISGIENDWQLSFPCKDDVRTFVLVGRTGNGKSSTGNTILGKKAFESKRSSGGVTITCELGNSVLENGQTLNVIDTPGLFDASVEFEDIRNEIVKCVEMAKDGIHAVLVVLSVKTRFSREEESVIKSLREIFGTNISEYIILVFTGGDDLEDEDVTLDDYLGSCPEALKEMLKLCGDRCVVFDNKTKDTSKKSQQLDKLLRIVDVVVDNRGGKPFTNEIFVEVKKGAYKMYGDLIASKLESSNERSIKKTYEEQLQSTAEMVESKLRQTTCMLERQLVEEQVARLKIEIAARDAQMQSDKDHVARLKLEIKAKEAKEQSDKDHAARLKLEIKAKEAKEQSDKDHAARLKLEIKAEEAKEQLDKERAARLKSETAAKEAKEKSDKEHAAREKEILKLRKDLEKAEIEKAVLKKKFEESCSIL